jgi:hypothetical protein
MGQSYRIRTELGINQTINVQLDQEFEFLEILSLKIQQSDIYTRSCADYGVVVGRITANNGFGLPNARVSVFIPIESVDESNPVISSIYPYKSPEDKNEDGYRYNLLPYEKSYSTHAATGTLPSRIDALTGATAVEIYDKYYKFTSKTNESGDYMMMGVPLGSQDIVMDVDLSDMGEFSLTPQDLIRMGVATEAQVAGNRFRTSNDLNSLPQLVSLRKVIEVSPLWGDPDVCQIAVNRLDFDLRDDANIDIQPTSVFMGSLISTSDDMRVRSDARPKDDMGNLCDLNAGPGQILAIRQTINQGSDGNPILEQYQLEQSGNIIDGNGVWLTELPMNLDYYITNEFGEKVLSNDPTVGIPTKAKYRFKIKWQQSSSISEQTRRAYFLVPNVKEYGWLSSSGPDPNNLSKTSTQGKQLAGSYYFGLDWTGYTNQQSAINCEDTFYQFDYNRVYTVSGFIDEFKNGRKGRFIGIKEIDNNECAATVNKFPVNDGFRNFDLLYFLFAIIFQVIQIIGIPLLVIYHFLAFLWNNFAIPLLALLILYFGGNAVQEYALAIAAGIAATGSFGATLAMVAPFVAKGLLWTTLVVLLGVKFRDIVAYRFGRVKLPMITYPECQSCECTPESTTPGGEGADDSVPSAGFISQISNPTLYFDKLIEREEKITTVPVDDENYDVYNQVNAIVKAPALSGRADKSKNPTIFKDPQSGEQVSADSRKYFGTTSDLPIGERVNIFNLRNKFFQGVNKIKVSFASDLNTNSHYDNTLTVLSTVDAQPGDLVTFVSPALTKDKNFLWTGQTEAGGAVLKGINGKRRNKPFEADVRYATSQTTDTLVKYSLPSGQTDCVVSVTLNVISGGTLTYEDCVGSATTIPLVAGVPVTISNVEGINTTTFITDAEFTVSSYGDSCQRYIYPADIEYFQVLTAITITKTIVNGTEQYSIPNLGTGYGIWPLLTSNTQVTKLINGLHGGWRLNGTETFAPYQYFGGFEEQKIVILQRGVDPYSSKYTNKYGIGKILGHPNEDDVVITASTRLNIPIQKLPNGSTTTVQQHNNQDNIFFSSYVYTPTMPGFPQSNYPGNNFSAYTTPNVGFYGALDSNASLIRANNTIYYDTSYVSDTTTSPAGVITKTSNRFYLSQPADNKYDLSEDLSGGAILYGAPYDTYYECVGFLSGGLFGCNNDSYDAVRGPAKDVYFSPILYPSLTGTNELNITQYTKNVMRTDRLPSSDYIDDNFSLVGSVSLLQQNLGFSVYNIESGGAVYTSSAFSTGASQVTPDIAGQLAATNVLNTMGTCEKMVGLSCYSGNGESFAVKTGCEASDAIENGCYIMMNKPLIDLTKDLGTFAEWGFRFRFFYGLCRGVLSQSFVNNWVNGTLYAFPIQVDTYYNNQNKPTETIFAKELIYFDDKTNNFYYRSSPYYTGSTTQAFIGRPVTGLEKPVNQRNLLFPTTIINLGIKDSFYGEIIFEPSAKGYIMNSLNATSYSDTSDLVNLFVISRITDEGFLSQLISLDSNNNLNQLFSRPELRIDGDLAQSMSINSEYGVIPFSPNFYSAYGSGKDSVKIIGTSTLPTMGVFFSSTTQDLQNKDYLSPGVIDFRPGAFNFKPSVPTNAVTYPYGIKSQKVPFYQWKLVQTRGISNPTIFGSQSNNWSTNYSSDASQSGIFGYDYQLLDRRDTTSPSYFIGSNTQLSDILARGYIFKMSANTVNDVWEYSSFQSSPGDFPDKFLVGAPNHFYFGLIKGETALDKFKTKYSVGE